MKKCLIALFLMSMIIFTGCDKKGEIPTLGIEGLQRRMTREEVKAVLGNPDEDDSMDLSYGDKLFDFLGYKCTLYLAFNTPEGVDEDLLYLVSIDINEDDNLPWKKRKWDRDKVINDLEKKFDSYYERCNYDDGSYWWESEDVNIRMDIDDEEEISITYGY